MRSRSCPTDNRPPSGVRSPGGGRCLCGLSAFHVLFHKIIHQLVQLADGVLGPLGQLAGGALHLALVLGGGKGACGTQSGSGGHTQQHGGGGRDGTGLFHGGFSSLILKFFGDSPSISNKESTIRFFCAQKCGILYDTLKNPALLCRVRRILRRRLLFLLKLTEPKKVLCIHDLSGVGRCSLAVILPVLSVMGVQPVALPTVVLSTHTGGLGTPARLDGCGYGLAALDRYRELGLSFDCIYTGYLGGEAQVALAEKAFDLWPGAHKVVDPVMGDNGKAYASVTPELIARMRALCRRADLILPNATEAGLLLEKQALPTAYDEAAAQALADELTTLCPGAIVTGVPLGKYIGCAGAGRERFVIKKLHIDRSFPGTGDLYGAVLIGSLIQGNALSAAADNAAEFVSLAIQKTPAGQDTRFGVWFEPLLPRLCPQQGW